jgi:hypothetical protein
MVKGLDNEVLQIKDELFRLCWYMRGGVTLDEAFALSYEERKVVSEIIKDNLETTKKTGMNFF